MSVSQNRGRWLISGLLIVAVFAFVGFSFVPIVSEAFKQDQPSASRTETPGKPSVNNIIEELKSRASGYEIVLQREPNNPTVLNEYVTIQLQLGQIYAQQQRLDDAIAVFDRTSKLSQKDYRPLLAKGIVLQLQGKNEEAKAQYDAAVKMAPAEEKEQLKAEIQQLETKMVAPANSPTTPKSNNSEANPTANPAPESNSKTNTEPKPAATATPESTSKPENGESKTTPTPESNTKTNTEPSPAATATPESNSTTPATPTAPAPTQN